MRGVGGRGVGHSAGTKAGGTWEPSSGINQGDDAITQRVVKINLATGQKMDGQGEAGSRRAGRRRRWPELE